jgi:hypothetical protein
VQFFKLARTNCSPFAAIGMCEYLRQPSQFPQRLSEGGVTARGFLTRVRPTYTPGLTQVRERSGASSGARTWCAHVVRIR